MELTALDLFTVPLPSHPTVTQVEAAHRLAPKVGTITRAVYQVLIEERRQMAPRELWSLLGGELNTIRSRLTTMHQSGHLVRTATVLDGELCYIHPDFWQPWMGCTPSRRHGAR